MTWFGCRGIGVDGVCLICGDGRGALRISSKAVSGDRVAYRS